MSSDVAFYTQLSLELMTVCAPAHLVRDAHEAGKRSLDNVTRNGKDSLKPMKSLGANVTVQSNVVAIAERCLTGKEYCCLSPTHLALDAIYDILIMSPMRQFITEACVKRTFRAADLASSVEKPAYLDEIFLARFGWSVVFWCIERIHESKRDQKDRDISKLAFVFERSASQESERRYGSNTLRNRFVDQILMRMKQMMVYRLYNTRDGQMERKHDSLSCDKVVRRLFDQIDPS